MDPELQKASNYWSKWQFSLISNNHIPSVCHVFPIGGNSNIYSYTFTLYYAAIAVVIEPIVVFFETRLRMTEPGGSF